MVFRTELAVLAETLSYHFSHDVSSASSRSRQVLRLTFKSNRLEKLTRHALPSFSGWDGPPLGMGNIIKKIIERRYIGIQVIGKLSLSKEIHLGIIKKLLISKKGYQISFDKLDWKHCSRNKKESVSYPRQIWKCLWKQWTKLCSNHHWTSWIVEYVHSFHSDSPFVAKPYFGRNLSKKL